MPSRGKSRFEPDQSRIVRRPLPAISPSTSGRGTIIDLADRTTASELISSRLRLAELQNVKGLGEFPGAPGQQRSLRRILHALSCAFARSPGARSFAWTRLAAFCGSGLFSLVRDLRQVLPW
jgi:hypothetical protein